MPLDSSQQNNDSVPKKSIRFRRSLITGSIVALLIAISPYLFYFYKSTPENTNTWDTFLFTITTDAYEDIYMLSWFFIIKFIPLMLLTLWFFTCKHWWYHVILIPMAMYCFQLFSVINDETNIVDEVELIYLIPIMMIVIPFVYLIRLKIFDKVVHGIDLKKLDEELERLDHLEDYHDESIEVK